jgi:hypothetical protein
MAATGDPSTFTFTMDALPGYTFNNKTKQVLCEMQILDEEIKNNNNFVQDSVTIQEGTTVEVLFSLYEDERYNNSDDYVEGGPEGEVVYIGFKEFNGKNVPVLENKCEKEDHPGEYVIDYGYYNGVYINPSDNKEYDLWLVVEDPDESNNSSDDAYKHSWLTNKIIKLNS